MTTITDLLEQGVPLEDVQRLAMPTRRTNRLYEPPPEKNHPQHRREDFDLSGIGPSSMMHGTSKSSQRPYRYERSVKEFWH